MSRTLYCAALIAAALLVPACSEEPEIESPGNPISPDSPLTRGDDFVAIPRTVDSTTTAARRSRLTELGAPVQLERSATSEDFYLAIHRRTLEDRYFLSAFMRQYFPGASSSAARSLGTRVVSFQVQNGKLFVFDVDDRATSSTVFDPQRIVDAYPIATDPFLSNLPGIRDYVIVDPSAGINRFDVISDFFGWRNEVRFNVELSFLQRFEKLADGLAYEQVFTGYAESTIHDGNVEYNPFRASGTLGISLRKYKEGSHYKEVPLPTNEHYFRSDTRIVPNTGKIAQVASHWDIYPGMKPIEWLISPELVAFDHKPEYADVDLVGAVTKGIEQWNEAFGFPVLKARIARPGESFARDDLSYVIFDPDPTLGVAFANWRENPNTGEIRGASVYFNSIWLDRTGFTDDAAARPPGGGPAEPARPPQVIALRWAGVDSEPLCARWPGDRVDLAAEAGSAQLAGLTGAQKLERYVADMIAHEIGHTLGLRHNFKGSLVPPTSSVMEYAVLVDSIAMGGHPGPYDIAAVRYLHGLAPDLPSQPFCTESQIGADPDCRKFDTGADPIGARWQPWYRIVRNWYLTGTTDPKWLDTYSAPLPEYAQSTKADQAQRALAVLLEGIAAPLDPAKAANPIYARGADIVLNWVFSKIAAAPGTAIAAQVDEQIRLVLENADGVRSYPTRRALVDALKKRQTLAALRMLQAARKKIGDQLSGLDPDQALLANDLLARIDTAVTPYFQ